MTPDKLSLYTTGLFTISSYVFYFSMKNKKNIKTSAMDNWIFCMVR